MDKNSSESQDIQRPSAHPTFGGMKVRIQMMALIGRIARYLVSITALTLLLVMLTYVLGLVSF